MGDWPGKPCSEFGSQWTGDSRERVKREEMQGRVVLEVRLLRLPFVFNVDVTLMLTVVMVMVMVLVDG